MFKNLNENEIGLLCYIAYRGCDINDNDIATLKILGITTKPESIKKLYTEDYINGNFWSYNIEPKWTLLVLEYLLTQRNDLLQKFKSLRNVARKSGKQVVYENFRDFFFSHYGVDFHGKMPIIYWIEDVFSPVFLNPAFKNFVINLPELEFVDIYEDVPFKLLMDEATDDNFYYRELISCCKSLSNVNKIKLEELYSLYSYYSSGKYYIDLENPQTHYAIELKAVISANKGDYDVALKYFDASLKINNASYNIKNVFFNPITNYYYILSLVHEKSAASAKKLEIMMKKDSFFFENKQLFNYEIVKYFVDKKFDEYGIRTLQADERSLYSIHFQYLFVKYFNLDDTKFKEKAIYTRPNYLILQHELSSYIELSEEEKSNLKLLYGDKPALTSIARKESWVYALEDIIKSEEAKSNTIKKEDKEYRIVYVLDTEYLDLSPILQYKSKTGAWKGSKSVSLSKLKAHEAPYMSEKDRELSSYISDYSRYFNEFAVEKALPSFVGTNILFNKDMQQISVEEEKPNLIIKKIDKKIVIKTNINIKNYHYSYEVASNFCRVDSPTNIKIIKIDKKDKALLSKILSLGDLPLDAEGLLKQVIELIGGTIEIFSDIIPQSASMESMDSDRHLCLRLFPLDELFRLDIQVKPNPEGTTYCQPGAGSSLLISESNGVKYQVTRDLENEEKLKKEILNFISDVGGENLGNSLSVVLSLENTLQLLEWTRNHADSFYIEWPEGVKMKLKAPVEPKKIHITFGAKQNWFEIEGEVHIDNETVMNLETFLSILHDSPNRFIKLGENEYTILSIELQKQLRRLESLSSHDHKKLKMPQVAINLIDDILDGDMDIEHDKTVDEIRKKIAESETLPIKVPSNLEGELRDYQLDGYQWITRMNSWGAGVCLADDMGLGKTIQTIACLLNLARNGASLVVAPASVVLNWRNELNKFSPTLNVIVLNQSADRQSVIFNADKFDVVLCSYGILNTEIEQLKEKEWVMVCLDEAHTIKNRETKMSAAAMQLKADNRLILTGTPIQNNLSELWNLYQFINPGLLGSYEQFRQKFIIPIEADNDFERRNQLKRLIRPFMLRRTKNEVAEELPEKNEIIIPVEPSSQEIHIYEGIRRKAEQMLQESNKVDVNTLAMITKLRQAACSVSLVESKWSGEESKIELMMELIDDLSSNNHRVLIFSQFTSFFEIVRKHLDGQKIKYLYLDGGTPINKRAKLVTDFQSGQCPLFLISLKAGGLGLNLTNADYVIHLDPWWNPAVEQQATDRAHRIGQTNKVTVYHLITQHTIEEKMLRLHKTKRDLTDSLLEGSNMSHKLTAQELLELINNNEE